MVTNSQSLTKVSVLMPVYNAEKYVRVAIESILDQTFRDFEFIIIDDGSTDSSADIIRSYHDPRILFLENSANVGIVVSLNTGLAMAQGDYIARMDADDISIPIRLEKQVDFLNHNERVGVVGSAVRIINPEGKTSRIGVFPQDDSLIRWTMCFTSPFAHGSIMMRREIVMKEGGYPASPAEDFNLWEQLSCTTSFANLPNVLLCLRRHEESLVSSSRNRAAILRDSAIISQRRITKILGEEVPISFVEKLWGIPLQKSDDALKIADLIVKLASVSRADFRLSAREIQYIENDAARRILKLLARPNITTHHRWQVYQLAHRLDPYGLVRLAIHRIGRTIRNLSLFAL
jgi:glycosyltransferase involved in cell wall biosynthesis